MQHTFRTAAVAGSVLVGLGLTLVATQAAAPPSPQGSIAARYYTGIPGTAVGNLTSHPKFPGSPDQVRYEPYFEAWAGGDINVAAPSDVLNEYGVQMAGYFYPATTGDYTFYLSADDNAQLFLSTDDDPANKKLIAIEPEWNDPRDYLGFDRRPEGQNSSAFYPGSQWTPANVITLQAGRAYYIEALMKEGGGGDNLSVSIDGELPIPGNRLSPFGAATAATIVAQPRDAAVYSGSPVTFNLGLDLPPGTTLTRIQWQKNGVDIPDSNNATLTFPATQADNNTRYKAIATTSAGVLTSDEATLNVATITSEFAQGVVKFEAYTGIGGGTAVADLVNSDKYIAGTPDDVRLLTGIDTPNGYGDNYGAKVSGFITPPETGGYHFFIRSDDASELWLSTTDQESSAVIIAAESGCCQAFLEPEEGIAGWHYDVNGLGQTTLTPINLVAGRRYAFYALVKEGGGGDFLQVAARKVGDDTPAGSLRPLAGTWIGANARPNVGDPQITRQPQSLPRVIDGTSALLTLEGFVDPAGFGFPLLIQWQKNGQDIPGANGTTYRILNATSADSGTYRAVVSAPSGNTVNSAEATVAVVPDTFPPEPVVGAVKNPNNTYDVGVTFDEPVDAAAGTQANYSISAGTVTAFKYYPNSPGVVLTVSGLTEGNTYSVTVQNVADLKGNRLTSATKEFTVGNMAWGVVGGSELGLGNGVVAVGDDGFDLYSDSIGEWATYDEATFVYEQITGDFDKKLRVEYQDASSQWARAGLIVRDVTNFGVDRAAQEGGEAGRYQKVHVNPVTTAMGTAGNNSWEGNRRVAAGVATTTAGGGGTPNYPNAWVRLQRAGDAFSIYRSDNGADWTLLGTTVFDQPMPATVFVGPEFAAENGNISDEALRTSWLAKIRDYGDTFGDDPGPGGGTVTFVRTATGLTLTFTGTLQSADVVIGPWTDMAGASPQSVTFSDTAKFYRVKP